MKNSFLKNEKWIEKKAQNRVSTKKIDRKKLFSIVHVSLGVSWLPQEHRSSKAEIREVGRETMQTWKRCSAWCALPVFEAAVALHSSGSLSTSTNLVGFP